MRTDAATAFRATVDQLLTAMTHHDGDGATEAAKSLRAIHPHGARRILDAVICHGLQHMTGIAGDEESGT
ncbi:hypothetical protein ACWDOR_43265 [Streptosporangium canum]